MRYLIGPRDRRYVKGYGCLSFSKNIGKNISNKYSQKLVDTAKKSAKDEIITASKRAIQKIAVFYLIGNKIADKIANSSKKSKELHSMELHSNEAIDEIPKESHISPQER